MRRASIAGLLVGGLALSGAELSIPRITVTSGAVSAGELRFATQGSQVAAFQVDILYDAEHLKVSPSAGPAASAKEKLVDSAEVAPGRRRILLMGFNQSVLADGVVVSLLVSSSSGAPGTYWLLLSDAMAADPNGNPVPVATINGAISVLAPPTIATARNAAYLRSTEFCSPGSWATLFGAAFTTLDPTVADTVPLPTRLGGAEVRVNDSPVPLLFVSESQVNFQCPRLGGSSLQVILRAETGLTTAPFPGTMREATPGLFTLDSSDPGQGAVLIAGSYEVAMPRTAGIPSRPARRGMQPPEFLTIYANGLGPTQEDVPVGSPAPLDHVIRMKNAVRVFLGGLEIAPDFAGLAPGAIGLYQINVPLTQAVPIGLAVPLRVEVTQSDGTVVATNEVTVAIE